jgi:hypothetical protein
MLAQKNDGNDAGPESRGVSKEKHTTISRESNVVDVLYGGCPAERLGRMADPFHEAY